MKQLNKRIISLLLALVMVCSMLPMTVLANESKETAENPWNGRSAVFVGDSITAGSGTTEIYYQFLDQTLGFSSVTAMGVPGSCISAASDYGQSTQPLIKRYQQIPSDELIVIFMGTNDYGHETPLGSVEDTQDGSFYGALNTIIPALVAKHSSSKIVFVTPLHRYGFGTSKILGAQFTYDSIPNGVGATLGDYVEALKTVCANNDVSVIDLYTECTLDPTDSAVRSIYIPDGLHPNAAGHELIAGIMESHIRGYIPVEEAPEIEEEPGEETELIYGNKFTAGFDQQNRASARVNRYLKAGTVITLKDPTLFQWACAKTTGENSCSNLGYFPDSVWTDKETAVVAEDGWVGFAFKYRDETKVFDLTKPLSDYITIEEPHTHTYKNGICIDCGIEHPNLANYNGKVISILGGSTCTFDGYIPKADGFNLTHRPRYPQSNLLTDVNDTWWMQVIAELDAKLGVNDSWAGSQVLNTLDSNSGDLGPDAAMASLTRILNLGANGTPDIILFYGAMNDIGRAVTLGDFDAGTAPAQVDLTATKWDNLADAYVAAIMRMQHFYPDAQIVTILPGPTASYYTEAEREEYCEVLKAICDHYGIPTVDLSTCGLTTVDMPDGTHPNAEGMDYITTSVLETLLSKCEMENGENVVYSVTHKLTGAKSSLGYYKGVSDGKGFTTTITGEQVTVTVNMGGVDITDQVYADGKITISAVTGDIVIAVKGVYDVDGRLQQLPENYCCNSNLWTLLDPMNEYYTANGWGNNSNSNYSVTFPVRAGDYIWATSFGVAGTNGYSENAVRITWFGEEGMLNSLGRDAVHTEFAKYGYITAPEGAIAVNIPMASNADKWEVYMLNREHSFEHGACTVCGESAPSLEGKTISILGASISTYQGASNGSAADTTNSTIRNNAKYYPHSVVMDVELTDTWWMQVAKDLGLSLLVNNSWSGSSLLYERSGTVGAYVDRCVQLHDNTGDNAGEMPDIIGIQMGTNDFQYYKDTLGTADIDYDVLITENEDGSYTYATPTTSLEAAAIVLHKISICYPDAEVYYLNISQRVDGTDELIQSFNAELKQVVEHFDAHIVDIYGSAITMADFATYIGDGRVHPNCLGMDAYTEAFKRALLENTAYAVDTYTVSMELDGVAADYGDDKIVVSGDRFTVNLTAAAEMSLDVTVTMGGKDVTAVVCANGVVTIDAVTDDVTITAKSVYEPKNYRWEFDGTDLGCVNGNNALTKNDGTTTDGIFSKTRYALEKNVVLMHDLPWVVEWKCEGTFLNTNGSSGARIFTSDDINAHYNARYIFKSNTNGIIAMGEKTTSGSQNYGIALGDYGIDWTQLHTYRLENRIAEDGSNMVCLYVDGEEIGPMNHYYLGTKDQGITSDWLSGKDFVFPYMGTDTHGFTNASLDYIQVWESHTHTYKNGICIGCGIEHPNLANYNGKVISILGDSISSFAGFIPVADGFNLEHLPRYPQDNLLTDVNETWWMQIVNRLDAKLGINDSWRGATISGAHAVTTGSTGENAAMHNLTRIQNLGSNGTPDVILFYGGTNDLAHVSKIGTFDAATAPTEVDLTTKKWDNLADGYVNTILRLRYYYPDAQIICLLPTYTSSYYTDTKLAQGNEVMAAICNHYGVSYVDLRNCGITTADLPDGIHPDANGMEYITNAVFELLQTECEVESGENIVYSVTHNLTGAVSSKSYYKGVSHGSAFAAVITGENVTVTVTMGGTDITPDCYADGVINIPEVTGAIVITAEGEQKAIYDDYLLQLPDSYCWKTNLWTILEHNKEYYTGSDWGVHASGKVYSVTMPITPGDQIYATSFGKKSENGGTINGIRLTWFDSEGVLKSLFADAVYEEFSANGYLIVPAGAVAVNVVMWNNSDSNELYILNRDHTYKNGTCTGCGEAQPGPVITQQPVNGEAKLGERYMVEVKAEGEGLKYQWYFRNKGAAGWSKSSVKDNTYDDVMTKARANREVYCVITDANGNSVTTDIVKLICVPSEMLEIVTQPTDGLAVLGEQYCVTVEAKGEGLKYQWYFCNAGSEQWYRSSVKDNTYDDVMTKARAGREVYCVITDAYGNTVTTDIAKLIRIPVVELKIVSQPADGTAAFGEGYMVEVLAQGEELRYQWYFRNAGTDKWYRSGVKDNTYDDIMTKARNGREIYCVITDAFGNQVTTDTVKLKATPAVELKLLSDLTYTSAAMGQRYCVTVNAQGEGLSYRWYFRNAGSDKWYRSSVKDNTYDDVMTKARANREVYCVITDAYGNQIVTDVVTLVLDK